MGNSSVWHSTGCEAAMSQMNTLSAARRPAPGSNNSLRPDIANHTNYRLINALSVHASFTPLLYCISYSFTAHSHFFFLVLFVSHNNRLFQLNLLTRLHDFKTILKYHRCLQISVLHELVNILFSIHIRLKIPRTVKKEVGILK